MKSDPRIPKTTGDRLMAAFVTLILTLFVVCLVVMVGTAATSLVRIVTQTYPS